MKKLLWVVGLVLLVVFVTTLIWDGMKDGVVGAGRTPTIMQGFTGQEDLILRYPALDTYASAGTTPKVADRYYVDHKFYIPVAQMEEMGFHRVSALGQSLEVQGKTVHISYTSSKFTSSVVVKVFDDESQAAEVTGRRVFEADGPLKKTGGEVSIGGLPYVRQPYGQRLSITDINISLYCDWLGFWWYRIE